MGLFKEIIVDRTIDGEVSDSIMIVSNNYNDNTGNIG